MINDYVDQALDQHH